jgi:site-specific DNA recombinase
VIRNVVHKGCITHNGAVYPGEHISIIEEDLWERANRAIAPRIDRKLARVEEDKHSHLLKGIVVCGQCGGALTPHPAGKKDASGRPYLYYTCTNVAKEGKSSTCDVRSIPARRLEELVISLLAEIGKYPEVIEKTVGVLRGSAQKEIGPIKTEIEKLSREIKELDAQEDRLAQLAQNPESGDFGAKLMREGRQTAERRNGLAQEREKLRVQVNMKEIGLINSNAVAQQLSNFGALMDVLDPEDQKDLVRLIVREVRVNRFDPAKEKTELGKGMLPVKIRTQWYMLNITFFANDLFSNILQGGVNQFVSKQEWLPGKGSNLRPSD